MTLAEIILSILLVGALTLVVLLASCIGPPMR
jgi:hypothetical protein